VAAEVEENMADPLEKEASLVRATAVDLVEDVVRRTLKVRLQE
jgi:hypothetical protein